MKRLLPVARQTVYPYRSLTFIRPQTSYAQAATDKYNFQSPQHTSSQVSCTVLGRGGNVTAISKKFPRTKFLNDNGLHPRDLRNMVSNSKVAIVPTVTVRPKCILVSMLQVQALIKHNEVLIFDNKRDAGKLGLLMYDLSNKLGDKEQLSFKDHTSNMPYELKALESILMNAVASLDIDLKTFLKDLNWILTHLEDNIDRDMLKELLIRSRDVSKFVQRARSLRESLSEVLEDDEQLSDMYLTDKSEGIARSDTDHAEAELLLEAYYKQMDEMVQQAERLLTNIKTTEEITNIMFDSNRNSLMLMELKVTIGELGFTVGMFFASLYGMNLENFIEETTWGFWAVSAGITVVSIFITWFNVKKFMSIKKIAMMNGSGRSRKNAGGEWRWLVGK